MTENERLNNAIIAAIEERDRLRAERDDFYSDYRMKCDKETKALHVERDDLAAENRTLRNAAVTAAERCDALAAELDDVKGPQFDRKIAAVAAGWKVRTERAESDLAAARALLMDVMRSLAAAISLLERGGKQAKKAAPSDKMFDQMLVDYRNSLERGCAALAEGKP